MQLGCALLTSCRRYDVIGRADEVGHLHVGQRPRDHEQEQHHAEGTGQLGLDGKPHVLPPMDLSWLLRRGEPDDRLPLAIVLQR